VLSRPIYFPSAFITPPARFETCPRDGNKSPLGSLLAHQILLPLPVPQYSAMLRVIPYPPPPRSTINDDNRMSGHHLHQQPRMVPNVPEPTPEPVISPATVSRVYRAATSLFLTRRLPDALMALQPIIADSVSPSARCSRTLRIKVWSLYFAILDATTKMGPEEGKRVWGAQEWRRIVSRVRSGAIWNEAIQTYGEEGRLDGDIVNTL